MQYIQYVCVFEKSSLSHFAVQYILAVHDIFSKIVKTYDLYVPLLFQIVNMFICFILPR